MFNSEGEVYRERGWGVMIHVVCASSSCVESRPAPPTRLNALEKARVATAGRAGLSGIMKKCARRSSVLHDWSRVNLFRHLLRRG